VSLNVSEIETPAQLLRRVYDEEFGFLPTNASMKPVHVANGVSRRLLGITNDHTALARVLRQFVKNQKGDYLDERNPNSAVLEAYGAQFADHFGNPPADEALTRFRSLAKDTLGADDAVFPTQASFTLSHRRMVTGDISDNGSGDFLAAFLTAGAPDKERPAAELLTHLLDTDTDPWTMIGWPLLGIGEEHDAPMGPGAQVRADRSAALLATTEKGDLVSGTLRELRTRYDQLATYEGSFGAKLTTLRRLLLLGSFVLHVHMVRRYGDVVEGGQRPPILLDLFDGRRRSLREASAATLQNGFRSIERLVLTRIRSHVDEVCGSKPEDYVNTLPDDKESRALREEFDAQAPGVDPLTALAEAFWKVGYSGVGPGEVKGLPWNALLALGRRSGYLLPYDNRGRGGKEHKRYGVNAEFAEVLVAATVVPGDPLDFDDFLDILRTSFGIVVGRTADFEVIRRNDLRAGGEIGRSVSVNEGDLRANLMAFRDLIVDIGLAKSYADGRTVVTTDEARG
jgi:hypothetical protein